MGRLIILLFILTGCFLPPNRIVKGIDPEMEYEVRLFESIYGQKISYPSIIFGDLSDIRVGVCTLYSNGNWEIIIDKEYWENTSRESRIGLIFHELGHCILHRGHEEQFIITEHNYQVPKSLMYPYNFYNKQYSFMWDYYSKELFIPSTQVVRNKTIIIID